MLWHANRGFSLLRTPGLVLFGTCICSTYWDQMFFQAWRDFPDFSLRTSECTFSIFIELYCGNCLRLIFSRFSWQYLFTTQNLLPASQKKSKDIDHRMPICFLSTVWQHTLHPLLKLKLKTWIILYEPVRLCSIHRINYLPAIITISCVGLSNLFTFNRLIVNYSLADFVRSCLRRS